MSSPIRPEVEVMDSLPDLSLRSETVGALPIVNRFLERLGLEACLEGALRAGNGRAGLRPARGLTVLLRNLLLARQPLYSQREWTGRMAPELLGLRPQDVSRLTDDCLGRALDRLFDADRATLLTEVVLRTVREFDIALDQIHTDSTTVTFSGEYELATGRRLRGKKALRITHGHNKDYRPDLKQLLFSLTLSADGAVPVHYRAADGNTTDDKTHIATWEALRQLAGEPGFLYVADSKLCTRENLHYIAQRQGRFITVLPATRSEDRFFRDWLQTHTPVWEPVASRWNPRRRSGPPSIWKAMEAPMNSVEGYRIVWVWSSLKAVHDEAARQARLEKAYLGLEGFRKKLAGPRCRYKSREMVVAAAEKLVQACGAERWTRVEVKEKEEPCFRQEKRGRPGKATRYRRRNRLRFDVAWAPNGETIDYDVRCDGIFPLITNDRKLSLAEILKAYKYQPRLEKRHAQMKSTYRVAPVLLKNEGRVEALLFLYFLVHLIQSLIEREVRQGMKAAGLKKLPLYPEGRPCQAPCTERILEIFEGLQRHHLLRGPKRVQVFEPKLDKLQKQVLGLLHVPATAFTHSRI